MTIDQATSLFRELVIGLKVDCKLEHFGGRFFIDVKTTALKSGQREGVEQLIAERGVLMMVAGTRLVIG